jgi:hypothetical protein
MTKKHNSDIADITDVIQAYPSQLEAAGMLRISASVLSRNEEIESVQVGSRGRHYSPVAVLSAGAFYKKRSLNEIAAELLDYARQHGDEEILAKVKAEVDQFFVHRTVEPVDRELFLKQARLALPSPLFQEVKRAFDHGISVDPELVATEVDSGLKPLQS